MNDRATSSTGADRHYVSHGLRSGQSYTYSVRVEYEQAGQRVVENKVASLTADSDVRLVFGSDAVVAEDESTADRESAAVQVSAADEDEDDDDGGSSTKLTLRVPADARVTLAGSPTRQTGVERQYLTTQLAAGQTWENYRVTVEVDRLGETLTQQRELTLHGGKAHELAFDFPAEADARGPKLAAAN
ncbi:MAG: TIGR03000 domain-containing protein [Planctomycetota bacterium]